MDNIDNMVVKFIDRAYLLPPHDSMRKKVAIIGERNRQATEGTLTRKLMDKFNLRRRNIKIYTKTHKFKAEYAEQFDVLIGTRPCDGEVEILEGAAKYKKKFILTPCTCGRLQRKIPKLIREHPVIGQIEAMVSRLPNRTADFAWMILYN